MTTSLCPAGRLRQGQQHDVEALGVSLHRGLDHEDCIRGSGLAFKRHQRLEGVDLERE